MCYRLSCHSAGCYSFVFLIVLCVYLFLAVLGLHCCAGFSPVAVSRLYSSCGVQASWRGDFSSCTQASVIEDCGLSNCGARTQLLHGKWGHPRPGIEPVCPAVQSGRNPWTTGEALIPHSFVPPNVMLLIRILSPREAGCPLFIELRFSPRVMEPGEEGHGYPGEPY